MNIEREIHYKIAILSCTSSSAGRLRRPTTGLGQSGSVNLGGRAARQLRIGPPHCRLPTPSGLGRSSSAFPCSARTANPSMVGGVQITGWSSPSREPSLPTRLRHYRFDPRDPAGRHHSDHVAVDYLPGGLGRFDPIVWRSRASSPRLCIPRGRSLWESGGQSLYGNPVAAPARVCRTAATCRTIASTDTEASIGDLNTWFERRFRRPRVAAWRGNG